MKMRFMLAFWLLFLGVQVTAAQGPGINPSNRPAFSPWLNLNRQGNSAALNYFGMVRPQFAASGAIQQLQNQTTALQQQESTIAGELPATGHGSGFLNHNRYFLNRGGQTPSSGRSSPVASKSTQPTSTRRSR